MYVKGIRISIALIISLIAATFIGVALGGCNNEQHHEPLSISVLTYYNGDQLAAFQKLVGQYNETLGTENNVVVSVSNVGSVEDLRDTVMNSAQGKVGAAPLPNMFMTYADTAFAIDQMGLLVDMAPYLSEDDRALYVDGYLEEGALGDEGSIKIFPVAKSTEILLVNKTDFEPFAQATGATYEDLSTIEGLVRTAEAYYNWTDSLTEEENDGKAFFGRDAMANYFFIGAKQLGCNILSVEDGRPSLNFDKQIVRKLWDNYYVPYIQGYFDAQGHYRSDDVKTGAIIALVGSSSGATYFPTSVIESDGSERVIEMAVLPCPQFEGAQKTSVQQGAGVAVIESSPEEVQASIDFLTWFASPEQNIQFSVTSGYLPVTKAANTMEAVRASSAEVSPAMEQILTIAMAEVSENELYTPHAFANGTSFRNLLEYSLQDLAASDSQVVEALMQEGIARNEALKPFLSDSHFEEWYTGLSNQLTALL